VTKAAVPHIIMNSFKNLAAVTFDSDYSFKQADAMKAAAANSVRAGPVATTTAAPVKAAAKEEEKPKEEEADVDMGGLFGDDY
jgi:large subunit ribosomal protein LP0